MGNTRNKHGPWYGPACLVNGNRGAPRSDVITLNRGPTIALLCHGRPGRGPGNGRGISFPHGIYVQSETNLFINNEIVNT
jgi:hypothetical protein